MSQASQARKVTTDLDVLIELTGSAVVQYRDGPSQEFPQRLLSYLQDLVTSLNLPIRFRLEIGDDKETNVPRKPIWLRAVSYKHMTLPTIA
jgi:hypothetical protein